MGIALEAAFVTTNAAAAESLAAAFPPESPGDGEYPATSLSTSFPAGLFPPPAPPSPSVPPPPPPSPAPTGARFAANRH